MELIQALKDFLYIGLCNNSWLWFHILAAAIGTKYILNYALRKSYVNAEVFVLIIVLSLALSWEFTEYIVELSADIQNSIAIYGSIKNWILDCLGDIFGAVFVSGSILFLGED